MSILRLAMVSSSSSNSTALDTPFLKLPLTLLILPVPSNVSWLKKSASVSKKSINFLSCHRLKLLYDWFYFDFNYSIRRDTHSNILLCIFQQELHCYQYSQNDETCPPRNFVRAGFCSYRLLLMHFLKPIRPSSEEIITTEAVLAGSAPNTPCLTKSSSSPRFQQTLIDIVFARVNLAGECILDRNLPLLVGGFRCRTGASNNCLIRVACPSTILRSSSISACSEVIVRGFCFNRCWNRFNNRC